MGFESKAPNFDPAPRTQMWQIATKVAQQFGTQPPTTIPQAPKGAK